MRVRLFVAVWPENQGLVHGGLGFVAGYNVCHDLFHDAFGHLESSPEGTVDQAEWENNGQKEGPLKHHVQADVSHWIKWIFDWLSLRI